MKVEMDGYPEWHKLDCVDARGQHFVEHLWSVIQDGVEYILKHRENYTPEGQTVRHGGKRKRT